MHCDLTTHKLLVQPPTKEKADAPTNEKYRLKNVISSTHQVHLTADATDFDSKPNTET